MSKKRVLFLSNGNSCRSQMAEGLVNHLVGERWEAHSAGTEPAGYVHPLAVEAMSELGIDISARRSKSVDEFRIVAFDMVVTVWDDAAESCPLWLGQGQVWSCFARFVKPFSNTCLPYWKRNDCDALLAAVLTVTGKMIDLDGRLADCSWRPDRTIVNSHRPL